MLHLCGVSNKVCKTHTKKLAPKAMLLRDIVSYTKIMD